MSQNKFPVGPLKWNDMRSRSGWFSRLPVIETERMTLRKVRWRDARDIYRWTSDPEVARYVLWTAHESIHQTYAYVRYLKNLYRQGLPSSWVIELKETGRVIGSVGFMKLDDENDFCEVGYSLAREQWNRGLTTEALKAVLAFAFDQLRVNRIEAQHDVRNPASGRVMEKCGMLPEGILRRRIRNKGEYVDVRLWAILADDRPGKKEF